jgi:hypothetical protein
MNGLPLAVAVDKGHAFLGKIQNELDIYVNSKLGIRLSMAGSTKLYLKYSAQLREKSLLQETSRTAKDIGYRA